MQLHKILAGIFLCICFQPCLSQHDLFDDTTSLKLTIVSDLEALLEDRGDSATFHKARFNFLQDGELVSMRTRIKARGNFRRNPAFCIFPPLKVKIEKENRKGSMFEDHKNLKLVCHCQEESAVLQEYLIYKMYQMLSPYSFQVRLAEITYLDLNNRIPAEKHYGFFIEDDKRMAKRNGGKRFEGKISQMDSVERQSLATVAAFMYMIGNLDWDIKAGKNLKFVIPQNKGLPLPVPYDFDWCAAVNASYTGLPEDFDRRDLRDLCFGEEEWELIAEKFLALEEPIRELYRDFRRLESAERNRPLQYYRTFFKIIKDPKKRSKAFLQACEE